MAWEQAGTMTWEEFLQKLRLTPRTWQTDALGRIRNPAGDCPGTAVIMRGCVGSTLGSPLTEKLFNAADLTATYHQPFVQSMRDELLLACGLEEQK